MLARRLTFLGIIFLSLTSGRAAELPLLHAHAHNDYLHARPLLDALDHGFCSVEADIYLVDGQLLVAHDRSKVTPERTLESLYMKPLLERTRRNKGRVFPDGPGFTLLIDLKTDWPRTYPVLRDILTNYAAMLTTYEGNLTRSNSVSVVLTGNRSRQMFAGEKLRFAALDADLTDLDSQDPVSLVPWISTNWSRTFKWRGLGEIPPAELEELKNIVARAHRHGRAVRFWGAPDNVRFWRVIREAGVDLVNTDDLAGLEQFLRQQ